MPSLRNPRGRIAASLAAAVIAGTVFSALPASADTTVERPDEFTSAFRVTATPSGIIDPDGERIQGENSASGTFIFMINSDEEIICYDIEFRGVTPPYESPARTATHIHEAASGQFGPPRLAFEDPNGSDEDPLTSSACIQGPFTTGVEDDEGNDTAAGFSLSQIEDDPSAFYADVHTSDHPAGAIRGQLRPIPVGGVDAGRDAAPTAANPPAWLAAGLAGGLTFAGLLGWGAWRRARV